MSKFKKVINENKIERNRFDWQPIFRPRPYGLATCIVARHCGIPTYTLTLRADCIVHCMPEHALAQAYNEHTYV